MARAFVRRHTSQRDCPGGQENGRGCCPLAFHFSGGRAGVCVDVCGRAGKQAQVCVHDCPYRRFAMIAARSAILVLPSVTHEQTGSFVKEGSE
jgi:hypothetical protein